MLASGLLAPLGRQPLAGGDYSSQLSANVPISGVPKTSPPKLDRLSVLSLNAVFIHNQLPEVSTRNKTDYYVSCGLSIS